MPPKKGKKAATAAPGDTPEAPTTKSAKTESVQSTPANTATKTGAGPRPVDREIPNRQHFTVYGDYAVTLNQTNIGGNNNKFYIIQLLEGSGGYHTCVRVSARRVEACLSCSGSVRC
jgi:poly [ADP-ribose] polymerase